MKKIEVCCDECEKTFENNALIGNSLQFIKNCVFKTEKYEVTIYIKQKEQYLSGDELFCNSCFKKIIQEVLDEI
jgi:hypothetical protein